MKKIICVTGVTGAGKTAAAIELAKKYKTEIISLDSVQIYKHLDIGSNKVTFEEMESIKHHLIDCYDPKETISVKTIQNKARELIEEVLKKQDAVILVGGTGLYFNAIIFDYQFAKQAKNDNLENLSLSELVNLLKNIDENYHQIDLNNKVRVVNAIRYYQTTKSSISLNRTNMIYPEYKQHKIINYYYDFSNLQVAQKIVATRTQKMIEKGLIQEVERLRKSGISLSHHSQNTIGYKQVHYFLNDSETNYQKLVFEINLRTIQYIKKQRKWFTKQFNPYIKTKIIEK